MDTNKNQIESSRHSLEPLAVDMAGLRHLIGDPSLSTITAWRMEKRGLIKRVPGLRKRLFTVLSVRNYIAGKAIEV